MEKLGKALITGASSGITPPRHAATAAQRGLFLLRRVHISLPDDQIESRSALHVFVYHPLLCFGTPPGLEYSSLTKVR